MNLADILIVFNFISVGYADGFPDYYYDDNNTQSNCQFFDGWFMGVLCGKSHLGETLVDLDENSVIQCEITKDGITIFSETILYKERLRKGYFADTDPSWHNSVISVSMQPVGNSDVPTETQCTVLIEQPSPREEENENHDMTVGESLILEKCTGTDQLTHLSKEQYDSISVDWYKGEEKIERDDPNYQYIPQVYEVLPMFDHLKVHDEYAKDVLEFDHLKILKANLSHTPGNYHCELKRGNKTIRRNQFGVCVKLEYSLANQPIALSSKQVTSVVDTSAKLQCHGQTTTELASMTLLVLWSRNGTTVICKATANNISKGKNQRNSCTLSHQNNICYDVPQTEAQIKEAQSRELNDKFTSTLTIENVTYADAGMYTCTLITKAGSAITEVVLVVKGNEMARHILTIVLVIVGGFCVIGAITIVLIRIFWIDANYFLKKCFKKYQETDREFVAYFVYSPDVSDSSGALLRNILDDTLNWFKKMRYEWYDVNKCDKNEERENNNAGALIANNIQAILRKCVCMVVVVTEQLLDQNEIELLTAYQGMDQTIRRDLPVIFVCTRAVRKEIQRRSKRSTIKCGSVERGSEFHRVSVTFSKLMKTNPVVYWDAQLTRNFDRALYFAVPKIRSRYYRSGTKKENVV